MNHLVIFGERPGPNTDPLRPLFPHTTTGTAARLIALLGVTQEEYLKLTRFNVASDAETSTASPVLRRRVEAIMNRQIVVNKSPRFLFLGKSALNAAPNSLRGLLFGIPYCSRDWGPCIVIPHPSGRNLYYNSEANTRFIEQSLRKFAGIL